MDGVEVASIVLFADKVERTVAFYRALGVPLGDEDHGDGELHAAADLGDVHVAVLPVEARAAGAATSWRQAGSTFTGFFVASLDGAAAALAGLGAETVRAHEWRPWGCRIVVVDPDGRAVEINQRDHCPASPAPPATTAEHP